MKFTRWLIVPALILPCFARGSLRGGVDDEKSPLARIPADARIVIQLRGIERTKERLVTMIQTDAPNLGPRAQAHFEGLIRMALKGRFQKGLARDGPHFMVYLESPKPGNEQVNLGFLLSVANYEEFLAGWLQPDEKEAVKREPGGFDTVVAGKEAFYLIDRHDYVVLSQRREFVTRLAKTQAGLNTILSKEQTRKFLDADLSVYVDVGTVNKELDKGIAAAIPGISQYIQLRSEVEGFPAAAAKRVSAEVCRAIDDTDRCLLTMEAKPKGLGIHAFFKLRRGTNTDRLLRAFKPSPHDPLARLPTGQTNYFGVQFDPAAIREFPWIVQFFMGDWKSSEEAKQLTEASPRNIVGARGISMEQLQVWEFRDPHKAVTAELKLFESLRETGTYRNAILKNKPVVKANVVNHRGFQFHEVTLEWDLEKTYKAWYGDRLAKVLGGSHLEVLAETLREGMLAYLEEWLGKRVTIWFGTDGKAFVRVGAKDWTAARTSLDCYLDKSVALGLDEAYQRAREELPAEAGLLVLVDVTKTWLFQLMDMPLRKVVKRKASYLGIAAAPTPQGMTLGLWIPNTVVGRMLFLDLAP